MNITVAGAGYVGLSNALLLAQNNSVILMEPNHNKVESINNKISPISDKDISEFLLRSDIQLHATSDEEEAYENADLVFVAVPTNNTGDGGFDTSQVEAVINKAISINKDATFIIKSTIPIGFTQEISRKLDSRNIFFSPEFLREGKSLYDCLYPSRIIIGVPDKNEETLEKANLISSLLLEGAKKKDVQSIIVGASEAEAIKLFANAYLAMRIGFMNELDSFAEWHNLNSKEIITGIGLDSRIGLHYNNPSFGFGGYCLPKDTRQLKYEFSDIPQELISAIVESNSTRKKYIASRIKALNPSTIGIYRLIMKKDSDNFRESSIFDIMDDLSKSGLKVVVYEPLWENDQLEEYPVIKDFDEFTKASDIIMANRMTPELEPYIDKVYSRDIFRAN